MRIRFSHATRVFAGLTLVLVAGTIAQISRSRHPVQARESRRSPSATLRVVPALVPDPVDGEPVPYRLAARRPIAVMIDNFTQARPQWGLSAASRVYEALTEGGITRYLAVFAEEDAGRIGPVRSARTQFLNYAVEMDAALAHVGGNADALALIDELRMIKDLDQFRYSDAFRRIFAPHVAFEHTVFTSTEALRAVIDQQAGEEDLSIAQEQWKDDAPQAARSAAQTVSIAFSFPEYAVKWVYRPATNDYTRQLGGASDKDAATGQVLVAKSIAIAVVPRVHGRTVIGEDTWTFSDIGSGPAWIVQDGVTVAGTWSKQSRAGRLRFLDQAGREIAFDRGPQWVESVPPEATPIFSPATTPSH